MPLAVDPGAYVTDSSVRSLRKILQSWPLDDVREFLEGPIGLRLFEQKRTGKVFPASSDGGDVRDHFLTALRRAKVRVRSNARVVDVLPNQRRRVVVESGTPIVASRVIVATGGLSYPRTGSDGFGFDIAQRLGHNLVTPYPALIPLYGGTPAHHGLAGIALEVTLSIGEGKARVSGHGDFLFTHRGYSGPVVLSLAHAVSRVPKEDARPAVRAAWLGRSEDEWLAILAAGRGTVRGTLKESLTDRLVDVLLEELGLWDASFATLRREERGRIVDALCHYDLPVSHGGRFGEAEVTGGGVPLGEVDPRTLQSRLVAPVYFCGEVLDAFGPIGGYNFLWAFVTGRLAGLGAAAG